MKTSSIFFLFLFCSFTTFAQKAYTQTTQQNNTFRLSLTAPIGLSFNASLEKRLNDYFSLVPKASLFTFFNNPVSNSTTNEALVAFIFDAELRYYFNMKRRIKNEKNVSGYSASYVSIEPYIAFNPLQKGNQSFDYEGNRGAYINLGVQKQFKHHIFINAFAGALIGSRSFKGSYAANVDPAHVGITVGYTF